MPEKEGKGGHGLQEYDPADGKFTSSSEDVRGEYGGKSFSSLDEFSRFMSDTVPSIRAALSSPRASEAKAKIEAMWGIVTEKYRRDNAWRSAARFCDEGGIEELATLEGAKRLFSPSFVGELEKIGGKELYETVYPKSGDRAFCGLLDRLQVAIVNGRFGNGGKFRLVKESEIEEMRKSGKIHRGKDGEDFGRLGWSGHLYMYDSIKETPPGKSIMVYRCMHSIRPGKQEEAVAGYVKPGLGDEYTDCAVGDRVGTFFSATSQVEDTRIDGGYNKGKDSDLMIHGIIEDASSLRVFDPEDGSNPDTKAIRKAQRYAREHEDDMHASFSDALRANGFKGDADRMARQIVDRMQRNVWDMAAILGFDACVGYGLEICVFNHSAIRISNKWKSGSKR